MIVSALLGAAIGACIAVVGAAVVSARRSTAQVRRVRDAERRAAAAERLAEVGALTSGLAHEIKNPLSTIGLNAQLLAESLADLAADAPPDLAGDIERITRRTQTLEREVERLGRVLGEFLEFAGELKLTVVATDLAELVDELCDFFLPQAESQGVRLRYEKPTSPVVSEVDHGHVKQALLNLMLNAVQATARSGATTSRELLLRVTAGSST